MPRFFVLFDLHDGRDPAEYERWAEERDAVTVRGLASVDSFEVYRIDGALGGDPPYRYVEVIEVNDMAQFDADIAGPEMQQVAAEFQQWADGPTFVFGERIV